MKKINCNEERECFLDMDSGSNNSLPGDLTPIQDIKRSTPVKSRRRGVKTARKGRKKASMKVTFGKKRRSKKSSHKKKVKRRRTKKSVKKSVQRRRKG